MIVEKVFEGCFEDVALQRARKTGETYRTGLNAFQRFLEFKKIAPTDGHEKLTPEIFISYCSWLLTEGYKKKTVNVYVSAAKFMIDWMVVNGLIEVSYNQGVRLDMARKSTRQKREDSLPRFPKLEDVEKMQDAVRQIQYNAKFVDAAMLRARDIAIIEFLVSSGCRNNEIVQMKISDLDFIERKGIVTGKGSKQRVVFFSQEAVDAMRDYWKLRGFGSANDPVFSRHDRGNSKKKIHVKTTTHTIGNVVKGVAIVAGIPADKFTPHYFRHAYAIKMLRQTGNLALVQDMLGHSSPASTRVYAKIYPDDLRDAYREVFG